MQAASEDAELLPPVSHSQRDCLFLLIPVSLVVYFPFIFTPIRLRGVHRKWGEPRPHISVTFLWILSLVLFYFVYSETFDLTVQ